VPRPDNLTTFMCRLSRSLGASTSSNPRGLSRPVMGLLCLYLKCCVRSQGFVLHCPQHQRVLLLKTLMYLAFILSDVTHRHKCNIFHFFGCGAIEGERIYKCYTKIRKISLQLSVRQSVKIDFIRFPLLLSEFGFCGFSFII
jgi:hypothetical protein